MTMIWTLDFVAPLRYKNSLVGGWVSGSNVGAWSNHTGRHRRNDRHAECFMGFRPTRRDGSPRHSEPKSGVSIRARVTPFCHSEEAARRPTRNVLLCEKRKSRFLS